METPTKTKKARKAVVVVAPTTPPTPSAPLVLVKYTLKAIIPTGPYANIQPEITVEGLTIDESKALILPHIDGLFKEYLNLSERMRPVVTISKTEPKPEVKPVDIGQSEASKKAKTALETSNSLEALDLIADRIAKSEKLTPLEKLELNVPLSAKRAKLQAIARKNAEFSTPRDNDTATPNTPVEAPVA